MILFDKDNNKIETVGTPMSGGEGDVYDIKNHPDLVVKIYNDKKQSKKQAFKKLIDKIETMCEICDNDIIQKAGWPHKIVYLNAKPVGFVMNKIKYANPIHQLFDTIDRKEKFLDNNWKYNLFVARNLACAVDVLHSKNVVIGDINESNFLIGNRTKAQNDGVYDFPDNGIVYSIDCDSFQIILDKKEFLSTVKRPEYFPPELYGVDLHTTIRTKNHDNFGLAVMIFQLLMLGKHPYSGIGAPGDITESICGGYFSYGQNAINKNLLPPRPSGVYSLIYNSLNSDIKNLFERAFSSDNNVIRPYASEWILALEKQIYDLAQCNNSSHFYNKNSQCIWCEIENEFKMKPWVCEVQINNKQMAYNFSNNIQQKPQPQPQPQPQSQPHIKPKNISFNFKFNKKPKQKVNKPKINLLAKLKTNINNFVSQSKFLSKTVSIFEKIYRNFLRQYFGAWFIGFCACIIFYPIKGRPTDLVCSVLSIILFILEYVLPRKIKIFFKILIATCILFFVSFCVSFFK